MTPYFCCDEVRRNAVRASANFNGIDFLEVLDSDAPTPADRQRILRIHFLKSPALLNIQPANVVITGGERIRDIKVDAVSHDGDVVVVHLSAFGDYAPYRLQLIKADGSAFDTLDPVLSAIDFSFKVECPSDFDCAAVPAAIQASAPPLEIDYLTKDYVGYRQLMLDRISALSPQWKERNAADLGVALVEVLAFVADQLSYRQDAVATEAYLGTARRRVSIRRHARLVDYPMHEGKNARALVQIAVGADITVPIATKLLTAVPGQSVRVAADFFAGAAATAGFETFETMHKAQLFQLHNSLPFYTWGDGRCFLPKGSVRATLKGSFPNLQAGAILIFEEIVGRQTGKLEDADVTRRHPVRLTKVTASSDPLGGAFEQPPTTNPLGVTEIEWAADDALPFALCLSTRVTQPDGSQTPVNVAVARGNIVLADHGSTNAQAESLGEVPVPTLSYMPRLGTPCATRDPKPIPPRFRPRLKNGALTYASSYDDKNPPASARAALSPALAEAVPLITLTGASGALHTTWKARRDLLGSRPDDLDFVVETESDGSAYLRFGDDSHGRRPTPHTTFSASYRLGGGPRGNVAREAISHAVLSDSAVQAVRNPLPAIGGVAAEDIEDVRRKAPFAFRTQARAVTPADYEALAGQHPDVQRAAAALRWTGSWPTVLLTIDRRGGRPVDPAFALAIRRFVEPVRLAGHDLEVNGPNFVSLEIEARVSVAPDHFRSDVEAALLTLFSNGVLPGGQRAVFNPDNFTFGQPVYLSPLYAAAQQVDGVSAIRIVTFQRQGQTSAEALAKGKLELGRFEIARLDNNPDFPERGVFRLTLEGGK
jgi:baseplate J-like protein